MPGDTFKLWATADIVLLTYLFLNGNQPVDPFKKCGTEASASTLTCAQPNCTP